MRPPPPRPEVPSHPHRRSAHGLSEIMAQSLPESGAQIPQAIDCIALTCHSIMIAVDYKLLSVGEEKITNSDFGVASDLPGKWAENRSRNYEFLYEHDSSTQQFLLTINQMRSKAIVNVLAMGEDNLHHFNLTISEFLDESKFPWKQPQNASLDETMRSLRSVWLTEGRLGDFSALFKVKISQKLSKIMMNESESEAEWTKVEKDDEDEDATKTPTEETSTSSSGKQADTQNLNESRSPLRESEDQRPDPSVRQDGEPPLRQPQPHPDSESSRFNPLADIPREFRPNRPVPDFMPPGFEDEHQMSPNFPRPGGYPSVGIGERDLYPPGLGPHDPLRIGPERGGRGGYAGGGGMYPTFEELDPTRRQDPSQNFDPMRPPGARYDPTGPGDFPSRFGGGRFGGGNGGFGSGGGFGGLGGGGIL